MNENTRARYFTVQNMQVMPSIISSSYFTKYFIVVTKMSDHKTPIFVNMSHIRTALERK